MYFVEKEPKTMFVVAVLGTLFVHVNQLCKMYFSIRASVFREKKKQNQ